MKFRRELRFHGTKRGRVRQSWNKINLFNLSRLQFTKPFKFGRGTFFQQKWGAKAITRGYHGEHIKERQWERMFSRRMPSVVDMNARYLAQYDGSEHAAGRGSGKDLPPTSKFGMIPHKETRVAADISVPTPYMQMVYSPMERRLDIAVFRALFASSTRQARQFVVHGDVTVNGKKMVHPGYLLNPGDMFQVDVERVMFATGKKKEKPLETSRKSSDEGEDAVQEEESAEAKAGESGEAAAESVAEPVEEEAADGEAAREKEKEELKALRDRVKLILKDPSQDIGAKQKKALRGLAQDVKSAMSRLGRRKADVEPSSSVADDLATLLSTLDLGPAEKSGSATKTDDSTASSARPEEDGGAPLTAEERKTLDRLLASEAENPYDPSKPYMTPWRPRPYMAPFAFIPRYLEVNQNICAAVYLRHPVSRPGMAEVPTPFPQEINQLAFNWYLRRR